MAKLKKKHHNQWCQQLQLIKKRLLIKFHYCILLKSKLGIKELYLNMLLMLLLSCFSRVRLCVTPQMAAYQAPHPWDSPGKNTGVGCHFLLQCMKVKSESEVSQPCPTHRPHGLQPTRLLHPWDFPGKSTGVGCHCLLWLRSIESIRC